MIFFLSHDCKVQGRPRRKPRPNSERRTSPRLATSWRQRQCLSDRFAAGGCAESHCRPPSSHLFGVLSWFRESRKVSDSMISLRSSSPASTTSCPGSITRAKAPASLREASNYVLAVPGDVLASVSGFGKASRACLGTPHYILCDRDTLSGTHFCGAAPRFQASTFKHD